MKYLVETLDGKAFSIDCDPCERLLSALRRAALEAGYDDSAYLSFDGKRLDESSEIGTLGVDPKLDVFILHGAAKPQPAAAAAAAATKRDADAATAGDAELHDESPDAAAAQGRARRGGPGQQAGAAAAAAASVPSLEGVRDALNGRRAEDARPTFLSRKKREQLRKQQEEAAARAACEEADRLQGSRRAAYDEAAKAAKEEAAAAAKAEAEAAASSRRQKKPAAKSGGVGGGEDAAEASALAKIQQRYLGGKKEKKAVVKMADRSGGSVPDTWDPKDDTTGDAVWSVSNQLLFGRGFIGGTDAVQQMHERGDMDYEDLLKERQNRELQERTLAMQRRNANREAAAKLDRATQDDESQNEA